MSKPDAEDERDDIAAKRQFLVDEPDSDSVRLCQSAAEQSQSESGTSLSGRTGGTPDLAEEPGAASFPAGAPAVPGGDDSRGTTASAAPGKDEPASASEKNIAESYREELLMHSLEALIPNLIKQGHDKEAEIGSRLLVDLTERRITASEAKDILELIQAKHKVEAVHYKDRSTRNARLSLAVSVSVLILLLGIGIGTFAVQRSSHLHRQALYQSDWRFLPVSSEKVMHSISGRVPTTFTITNRLEKTVSLYWLNYQGERELKATLEPGQAMGEQTYLTHPFVVVDDEGKAIMLFLPGTKQNEQIEVR